MRNLSYREASVSLVLIVAAVVGAYRMWFAPALAQIERDRRTLEELVVVLGKPLPVSSAPALGPPVASVPGVQAPLSPPVSNSKGGSVRPQGTKQRRTREATARCAPNDPLCGDLEL
jgi:hypothetical protein